MKADDKPNDAPAVSKAFLEVVKAIEPLAKEPRKRVLNAVCILLNIDADSFCDGPFRMPIR